VGKEGGAPIPVGNGLFGQQYMTNPNGTIQLSEIDEETLKKVAALAGGKYFRATDAEALARIYSSIRGMEKEPVQAGRAQTGGGGLRPLPVVGAGAAGTAVCVGARRMRGRRLNRPASVAAGSASRRPAVPPRLGNDSQAEAAATSDALLADVRRCAHQNYLCMGKPDALPMLWGAVVLCAPGLAESRLPAQQSACASYLGPATWLASGSWALGDGTG